MRIEELKVHFPTSQSRNAPMVKAVDGVTFDVPRNTIVGGRRVRLGQDHHRPRAAALFAPTAGRILFDGQDITNLSEKQMLPWRRRMQIVFQDPYASLNPRMTVSEILGEALDTHKLAQNRRAARIGELLERVGLNADHARRYPHEFSGGQRQRIGIARALAVEPDFIVADEPVSALDVSVQAQVLNLLQDLQRDLGLTMLFVAHDLAVVDYLCDEVVVMYLGRVMERGPTSEVYARPRHPYTRALLSAAPVPDPRAPRSRILLKGDIPSPVNPPSGCVFRTRCPHATEACAAPPAANVGGASCGLYPPRRPRAGGQTAPPIQDPSHEEQHPRHRFPDTQPARRPERHRAQGRRRHPGQHHLERQRHGRPAGRQGQRQHRHDLALRPHGGLRRHPRPEDEAGPGQHRGQPLPGPHRAGRGKHVLRAHLRRYRKHAARADLHRATVRPATAIAHEARMIYVFGMGGASAVLAQEVQSRLVRLGYPIAVYTDAVLLRMVAATLDERDAVLILSASGLTPEILGAARIVKQYRARIVAITDATSPLAEMADVVLPIRTDETDFIYKPSASRYAMMLAIDLLATELAMLHQEENRERLRRIKLALDGYRGGPNRLPLGD